MWNKYQPEHYIKNSEAPAWYARVAFSKASDWMVRPVKTELDMCFVVGCGHSGTTLLASKLGQHPSILTIGRETGLFFPNRPLLWTKGACIEWLYFAKADDKAVVVEKTPKHVHCLGRIRKLLPESKLILMSRGPLDCIASLYARFGDLSVCMDRWVVDNGELLRWLDQPGVIHVTFEDLVAEPKSVFMRIVDFLDLEWDGDVLAERRSVYDTTLVKGHMVKRAAQVSSGIQRVRKKWPTILSSEQAGMVRRETEGLRKRLGHVEE